MKEIYLHKKVQKCTEAEFKVLSKFFNIKEEIVCVPETDLLSDMIYKIHVRKVFKDIEEVKSFANFINKHNLNHVITNTSRTGKFVAIDKKSIREYDNLETIHLSGVLFNKSFRRLYVSGVDIQPINIGSFSKYNDYCIEKYEWIFDMEWTYHVKNNDRYNSLKNDLTFILKKLGYNYEATSKKKMFVVKPTIKK